jgi:hypothetical protein
VRATGRVVREELPVKTMMAVIVAALVGLHIGDADTAKKAATPYRAESSASVIQGKEGWTFVTENRSFRFVELPDDQGNPGGDQAALLLLEETYHNEHTDFIEGVRGKATVKAWTLRPRRPRELRWSFEDRGNEGIPQDRFFRVTTWGCCDVPVVYSYYSLLSGRKLYVSNSDLLKVRGDDGPRGMRLVAFGYSGLTQLGQPPQLQYGSDIRITQRFAVMSSRQYYDAPQMFASTSGNLEKSLDLRGSELTFTIVLKYNDGIELRIPVEADTVRPEKAVLPEGYSLRVDN